MGGMLTLHPASVFVRACVRAHAQNNHHMATALRLLSCALARARVRRIIITGGSVILMIILWAENERYPCRVQGVQGAL